jgi:spermidine dehydrogenase
VRTSVSGELVGVTDVSNERTGNEPSLDHVITRRDFVSGIAAGAAGAMAAGTALRANAAGTAGAINSGLPPGNYPPAATGLRGQYPGSFEAAHAARDGAYAVDSDVTDTGEHYDLVVIGAGISGLSAAHFFRRALGEDRRILILDNHDDFGGHAKRNEFHYGGRTYLGYGGTMSIETPFPYSYTAKALLQELGIDTVSYPRYEHKGLYQGLGDGIFFDREHFNADKLVVGVGDRPWAQLLAQAPLSAQVRDDLVRVHTAAVDYLPQLDPDQKAEVLKRISYQEFLVRHAGLLPASLPFFASIAFRNNMRVDTCPAFTAARYAAPGFQGMKIMMTPMFESEVFHFPDGNASIARLLVSRLVPGVFPGAQTPETIVTALANYDALDTPASPTRIRLRSTAVHVEHVGPVAGAEAVRVVYVRDGKRCQVSGGNVVMACFNNIIGYVVPDLPDEQKRALAYPSKVPMQYTNVLVRNWEPWRKLGVKSIEAPNGYHTWVSLDIPVSIGAYRFPTDPREPIVVHMVRNPNKPGLPRKEQNRAGRAEMLSTPFEKIEVEIRSQLARMLGPGGFDARRDILAITVNRWPHGYAYTYDTLADPDLPEAQRPHVLGRRAFGRIAIANADSGAAAFTNVAIDQAERAVQECLSSRGMI